MFYMRPVAPIWFEIW